MLPPDEFDDPIEMKLVDLTKIEIPQDIIQRVPSELARQLSVIPISYHTNILTIAISDPLDLSGLDDVRFVLNCEVLGGVAPEEQIVVALKKYYSDRE